MTTFNVVLCSTLKKFSETKILHLPVFPSCTLDIKNEIENAFSIPVCVQMLSYQSTVLNDKDSIDPRCVRSGDTFHLTYPGEGSCNDVKETVEWIRKVTDVLQKDIRNIADSGQISRETDWVILQGILGNLARYLSLDLFYPWSDDSKYVNKLHFRSVAGLEALVALYAVIVSLDWNRMPYRLKYMECVCVQSIANFTQTFALRRQVVKLGGLELCLKSLMRKRLVRGLLVADEVGGPHTEILQCAIEIALYSICNLSELPECQLPISKDVVTLNQAVCISVSPSFTCKSSIVAASLFLCLAQSIECHPFIAKVELIEGLLDACRLRTSTVIDGDDGESLAAMSLECYTAVVLAQIAIASLHLLPNALLPTILALMERVLRNAKPSEIRSYEEQEGLVWGTFIPYFRLLYLPNFLKRDANDDSITAKLQLSSICLLLHTLLNALGRTIHREILVKEGMLPFTMSLPWCVPFPARESARKVVAELGVHIPPQPPSLGALARAKLAKMHFGLDKITTLSVAEIVNELC